MKHTASIFTILVILFLASPSFVFAAGLDLVNITMTPKTPGENQNVTVSIESYAVNLNSSSIIWYVNKDPKKQGIGEKSLALHTGNFGEKMTVDIVILSADGRKIEKQVVIAPSEIDLLWEAQTYTPPFYKGKALPTYKSLVKMTAIPRYNSEMSDPSRFTYLWKYNRTLGVGEGLGRTSALIDVGYAGTPIPVTLDVSLPGEDWSGSQYTTVTAKEASLVLYEQAPLLGIQFNHALRTEITGSGNQFTLRAVPYFFSKEDQENGDLFYGWTVNGATIVPGADPSILTLNKKGSGLEGFNVSLKVQTLKHILQQGFAKTAITLPLEQ